MDSEVGFMIQVLGGFVDELFISLDAHYENPLYNALDNSQINWRFNARGKSFPEALRQLAEKIEKEDPDGEVFKIVHRELWS